MHGRTLGKAILRSLSDTPVVFLHGARQTGKTTLAQELASGPWPAAFLTLDDAAVLAAARGDPAGFIAGLPERIVLDEVQRAPELFPAIKLAVDRDRRPGRFLLTGSAHLLFLPKLSESLAGRMEILTLYPFSQGELEDREEGFVDAVFAADVAAALSSPSGRGKSAPELMTRVLSGGYPEPLERPESDRRRAWYGAYLTAILQRDVRDIAHVEGLAMLPRLLEFLAARAATVLNYSEVSRASGLPQSTLKRYLDLLEATFLVQRLPPWSGNLGKRLVKASKLLVQDTGLMAYLLGLNDHADGPVWGRLLEDFVSMEVQKQIGWSRVRPRAFHFRTHAGYEVDLVLEDGAHNAVGIEVKASATVSDADFKGLRALQEDLGAKFRRGVLFYAGQEAVPFGKKLTALPVSALWGTKAVVP